MDILTVVRDGAEGRTQIVHKSNLSWALLKTHLKKLVDYDILSEHNIKNKPDYRLTEKGISILRFYTRVADQLDAADHYRTLPNQKGERQDIFGLPRG